MTNTNVFPMINPALTLDWLKVNATGKGVQVAIIDSGIDALHPALQERVVRTCVVGKNAEGAITCEETPVEESIDNFGHGTAVAGCVTGVAPAVEIINIKVLNQYNACTGDILIAGLEWALQQGIRLINMSLATSKQQWIQGLFQLAEQAYLQSAIIVASRRNVGDLGCPAMFSSVISVDRESYTDRFQLGYRANNMIEYDARGTEIEVLAPGGGYAIQTGTSFATPHVTGMVALLLEKFPTMTGPEAKAILKAMAQAKN
ncbi:Serine protease [Pseudomonas sp. 9AZ]|uniref:S8 family serine peptidase n=1 Tax=Pseudomonas sp. 9AZ TaxID=2653168 RepID=UPI0012EF6112|nr:S8 family serine peptidase [Pseudomonas sp. 9AZ]VXD00211.1 Serine protease [Pseudomonas sp. 9AZ]